MKTTSEFDKDGNEIYIAGSGEIPRIFAEHIVNLHNEFLKLKREVFNASLFLYFSFT